MKTIGIFGASGFARQVNEIANEIGFQTIYIVRNQEELDS